MLWVELNEKTTGLRLSRIDPKIGGRATRIGPEAKFKCGIRGKHGARLPYFVVISIRDMFNDPMLTIWPDTSNNAGT